MKLYDGACFNYQCNGEAKRQDNSYAETGCNCHWCKETVTKQMSSVTVVIMRLGCLDTSQVVHEKLPCLLSVNRNTNSTTIEQIKLVDVLQL